MLRRPSSEACFDVIDLLLETMALKALPRSGWERKGVINPESVAGHSWGVSWLVLLLLPDDLNRERALAYAVLHDIPEVRTGDITPSDGVPAHEKARREQSAFEHLASLTPKAVYLHEVWQDYEKRVDAEADFVHQLDKLEMAIQATVYAEAGYAGMPEFIDSATKGVYHPALVPLIDECRRRIQAVKVFTAPPAPPRRPGKD
jgi:putative hydrolases of HD superfamily